MAKKSKKTKSPGEGWTGSIGKTQDDDVVDSAFSENARPLPPESEEGPERFEADTNRQPLASGGAKIGEALQLSEEDDDFEDGRSSAGRTSRSQEDQWGRGDIGSRATDAKSGYMSVEGTEESVDKGEETTAPPIPKPDARRSPGENPPPPPGYAQNA